MMLKWLQIGLMDLIWCIRQLQKMKKIQKLFEQSEKLRMKAHKIIVDDNTWKFEFARGNQRKLKVKYNYDRSKNDRL